MTSPGTVPELPITQWLSAYRTMMAVDLACELRVFTLLDGRPHTAADLATLTGTRLVPLTSLLDACVGLGLLSVEGGAYTDREAARVHFVEGRPLYCGDLFRVFAAEAPAWQGLRSVVMEQPPDGSGSDAGTIGVPQFTRAMHALGVLGEAEALTGAVDLTGRRNLVDVGCGSGVYSLALCRRYPELRATLIDQPQVLEVTIGYVTQNSLETRVTLMPADFLHDGYGEGRDVVLLSDVLYQESEACRTMLRLARESLVHGGILVIRGYFCNPGTGQGPFGALFDLDRLLTNPSREPLLIPRLLGWLGDAGFVGARSFPLTERSTCVVATG